MKKRNDLEGLYIEIGENIEQGVFDSSCDHRLDGWLSFGGSIPRLALLTKKSHYGEDEKEGCREAVKRAGYEMCELAEKSIRNLHKPKVGEDGLYSHLIKIADHEEGLHQMRGAIFSVRRQIRESIVDIIRKKYL